MNGSQPPRRVIVGVTGASGAEYARRLVECICLADVEAHLIVSPNGRRLFQDELGIGTVSSQTLLGRESDRLFVYNYRDVGAKLASGSFPTAGMVVCPCSVNTLNVPPDSRGSEPGNLGKIRRCGRLDPARYSLETARS